MLAVLFYLVCFLLSGACGLMYETVWVKQAGYAFGSTVTATTTVLGAYMGGLALGSWAAGRVIDRVKRPLRVYGWLEIGIAVAAFAFPPMLAGLRALDHSLFANASPAVLVAFEIVGVSLLLLVPTGLMGATLPVLCRCGLPRLGRSGSTLGILYAANSAGAVVGGLVAGFWMVQTLGLAGTARAAQILNVAVGIAALAVDAWMGDAAAAPASGVVDAARSVEAAQPIAADDDPARSPGVIHVHVFLCGFAAMLYEIALMKLLPLIVGSSTQSFSLMVSSFILGIALGSALFGAFIGRKGARPALLGALQLGIGLCFMLSIPFYGYLPHIYLALRTSADLPYEVFQGLNLSICVLAMLLPTVFLGGVLPAAAELVARGDGIGTAVGRLYAANTIGNILGTAITGLVLVPHVGFKATMEIGVAINVACGLVMLWRDAGIARGLRIGTTAAVAGAVGLYAMLYPVLDVRAITAGVFRAQVFGVRLDDALAARIEGREVLYSREDEVAFVTVERVNGGLTLRVNGKADASSGADMHTQKLLAHLPLLLHPAPKTALVIGLGSGVTLGSALKHGLTRAECAELSPAVIEAARMFGPWNFNVLDDPRVKVVLNDGRNHVERSREKFDVLISEPSNPWMAGIGSLYTEEFFRLARDRLAPGGRMAQWMHLYEMETSTFRMVLRTIQTVFPHVLVMRMDFDVAIIASMDPIPLDLEELERRTHRPGVREDLASVGVRSLGVLAAHHYIPEEQVWEVAGVGPTNRDDFPLLEYLAPPAMYRHDRVRLSEWVYQAESPHNLFGKYIRARGLTPAEAVDVAVELRVQFGPNERIGLLRDALARREDAVARSLLANLLHDTKQYAEAIVQAQAAFASRPDSKAIAAQVLEYTLIEERHDRSFERPRTFDRSLAAARALERLAPEDHAAHGELGHVLYLRGDLKAAEVELRRAYALGVAAPKDAQPKPQLGFHLLLTALCRVRQGDVKEATKLFLKLRDHLDSPPNEPELERELSYRLLTTPEPGQPGGKP